MEYDNYVINDNGIEITIYPMADITLENDKFIIYVKEVKDVYSPNDFYIGHEKNDTLVPVNDKLITKFEKIFDELIKKVIESKRDK